MQKVYGQLKRNAKSLCSTTGLGKVLVFQLIYYFLFIVAHGTGQ